MEESKLAEYELVKKIGQGRFGYVDLYRHKKTNTNWINKIMDYSRLKKNEIDVVRSEVEIMKLLNHPNIIRIKEDIYEKGTMNILMEFAEGGDLSALIEERKKVIPIDMILKWFSQIALALQHAHSLNIIHRDLKPANVFLDKNLNVKIGDFGVSKMIEQMNASASTYVGSSGYMAPEVEEHDKYNQKCDIWSMGVILYELYTLKKPYERRFQGKINPIERNDSDFIKELIYSLLKKNPDDRPDMNQLIKLLEGKKFQKICYENGDVYTGETEFFARNGYGIYYWNNGDKFEGKWKDDIKENGFGIFYSKNGYRYEGEWFDEKKNGIGIYYSDTGDILESECNDDMVNGYGVCSYLNGIKFEGQFKNMVRNGYGIYSYNGQTFYEGQFMQGNMDGYGIFYDLKLGDRYEGSMNDSKKIGVGIYYQKNGEKYEGELNYGFSL